MSKYYVIRAGGVLELRQDRLRSQRNTRNGEGHPHDVCAVARNREEMADMVQRHFSGEVDWSAIDA